MIDRRDTAILDCHIGVAGCGAMGLPMLYNLVKAGFNTTGYDILSASHYREFAGHMEEDTVTFAGETDILVSVVRDYDQTEELCFKTQKLFAGETYPRILILSSTLSPQQFHDIASRLPSDVIVIDAPMSGAPVAALNASLTFMVGAEKDIFDYLLPLFQAMGSIITRVGHPGKGMAVKVLNNYVAACSVVAVRRVLDAAQILELDQTMLLDVMKASSGATWYGDNFDAIEWSREGYDHENTIAILEKDVTCALEAMGHIDPQADSFAAALLAALRNLKPFK